MGGKSQVRCRKCQVPESLSDRLAFFASVICLPTHARMATTRSRSKSRADGATTSRARSKSAGRNAAATRARSKSPGRGVATTTNACRKSPVRGVAPTTNARSKSPGREVPTTNAGSKSTERRVATTNAGSKRTERRHRAAKDDGALEPALRTSALNHAHGRPPVGNANGGDPSAVSTWQHTGSKANEWSDIVGGARALLDNLVPGWCAGAMSSAVAAIKKMQGWHEALRPVGWLLLGLTFLMVVRHVNNAHKPAITVLGVELSDETPVIGGLVFQWRLLGAPILWLISLIGVEGFGLGLLFWGHPFVYALIFEAHFVLLAVKLSLLFGTGLLLLQATQITAPDIAAWLAVVPLLFSFPHALTCTRTIFDAIPGLAAFTATFLLATADQMVHCSMTSLFYNRSVWLLGWHQLGGWLQWPLLFCYNDQADSKRAWFPAGVPRGCADATTHAQVLNCMCKADLRSANKTLTSVLATRFCDSVTAPDNIYRLCTDMSTCLTIGHVVFCGLVYAVVYSGLHRAQRLFIIYATTFAGIYLAAPLIGRLGAPAFVTTAACSTAGVWFQYWVATRATRAMGLDVSPPDKIPVSFREAELMARAATRAVFLSMRGGIFIALCVWLCRLSCGLSQTHLPC